MDFLHFFNLRSLAKRDHIITDLKIDLAELKANKDTGLLKDILIKKKQAELEIEMYQREEFVRHCKLN